MKPIHRPLYRVSSVKLTMVKKKSQEMLEYEFIRFSNFPYGSPVFFVIKKDDSLCLYIDYHWRNKLTIQNRYLLDLLKDMLDHLGGAREFSEIDLKLGN